MYKECKQVHGILYKGTSCTKKEQNILVLNVKKFRQLLKKNVNILNKNIQTKTFKICKND